MINTKYLDINYFESESYRIKLYKNFVSDNFYIYINNSKITIQRIDNSEGWGQDLNIIIRDKILSKNEIINIGPSETNIKEIDFILNENPEILHYENDNFKIFYISNNFDDVFKVDYDIVNKIIFVKRIDSNLGWGQMLKLKYIDNYGMVKIINIGKSIENSIKKNIDVDNLSYKEIYNYYESDKYIITLTENKYKDLFLFFLYEENNTIYIERSDMNDGWGQNLFINIYDIEKKYNFIIHIGSSLINKIYKKIDLTIRKFYVSMTTIPSRIVLPNFLYNVEHFLNNQTFPIERFFIVIANNYKRFSEKIPDDIIRILNKIHKIKLIILEDDLGPASKYMGPLLNFYEVIKNNLLIIIDDDRIYNKNLIKHFSIGYNSYPNIIFSTGLWNEYFNKKYKSIDENFLEFKIYNEKNDDYFFYGQGVGGFFGFCIKVEDMQNFIDYNLTILNRIEKSFYHDEGIIIGYLKYNNYSILYLKHYGCNFIDDELVDALCKSNLVNRSKIEKKILQLSNLENL
jgi:hypothetical protein